MDLACRLAGGTLFPLKICFKTGTPLSGKGGAEQEHLTMSKKGELGDLEKNNWVMSQKMSIEGLE